MGWWRGAAGALALALIATLVPAGSDHAEALTRVRARVSWRPVVPYEPNLREYEQFLRDNAEQVGGPLTFFRDNTLTRRSNPDPQQVQVLPGTRFTDQIQFTPTIDIENAVLHIHQPALGPNRDQCHAVVTAVVDGFGDPVGPNLPAGGSTEINLGRLTAADAPYEITLVTQIPAASQLVRPTPKLLTSVIRILEKVPSRNPGPPPPPRLRACGGEIGGRGFYSLNRTLVIRTELQLSEWARRNGRPTPTPISRSGG